MSFQYSFTGPFEGYVHNFLKSNYWKVQRTLEYDDVMQEARLKFYVMLYRMNKNGHEIKNQKHLMALFKTSWNNHFITMAKKSSSYKENSFTDSIHVTEEGDLDIESIIGYEDCQAFLDVKVNQATGEVKEVLNLILNTPKEVLDLIANSYGSKDVFNNKVLCRILGKNSTTTNLIKMTKLYLSE